MRYSAARIPALVPLFYSSLLRTGVRGSSHLPSSAPPINSGNDADELADATVCRPQSPTDRLAVASSSHTHTGSALSLPRRSATLPAVPLAPAVAALLEKRSRDSVVQQDVGASDLLYFMNAEVYAIQKRRRQRTRTPSDTDANLQCDPEDVTALQQQQHALAADAPLASRAQQLADFTRGYNSQGHQGNSGARRRDSALFHRQQKLFALRRRLAYILADDDTGLRPTHSERRSDAGEELSLSALRRRAALALSLAQDVFSTSEACHPQWQSEEGCVGGGKRYERPTKERLSERASWKRLSGAEAGASSTSSFIAAVERHHHHHFAQCAFVYRSLAQPVELTGCELSALLVWCGEGVRAYASAVRAAIGKDHPPSCYGGGDVANGDSRAPRPVQDDDSAAADDSCRSRASHHGLRTSGARPPPTLQMVGKPAAARSIHEDDAIAGGAERESEAQAVNMQGHARSLPPEVCESIATSVKALLELAEVFVQMAATLVLSSSTGVAGSSHDPHVYNGDMEESEGGEACDQETLCRGKTVRSVVDAVCDTLYLFRVSSVLDSYVYREGDLTLSSALSELNEQHAKASASPTQSSRVSNASDRSSLQLMTRIQKTYRSLRFNKSFMRHVLCCSRESWLQALQLTRHMHCWNMELQEALKLPATSTPTETSSALAKADCNIQLEGGTAAQAHKTATAEEPLRSLPFQTLLMLLYILAQHGRLAEVLDLCQRCLKMSAVQLLTSSRAAVTNRSLNSEDLISRALPTPTLQIILNLAAATAVPGTVAPILSSVDATTASDSASTSEGCALRCSQLDCLKEVVCAGAMPQRVLSVTEYAMLLRRMIGERLPQRQSGSSAKADAAKLEMHSSYRVGWWLSPSQVWRFSAGYPHHVRTTLCLMGFQVSTRRGLTATLSMEDFYVVLSISRQLATRQRRETIKLLDALRKQEEGDSAPVLTNQDDDMTRMDDSADGTHAQSAQRRREQRWASWGVEERIPPSHGPIQQRQPGQHSSMPSIGKSMTTSCSDAERRGRPPLLFIARRMVAPYNAHFMECLCAAFAAAQRGVLPLSRNSRSSQELDAFRPPAATATTKTTAAAAITGSAVLLSLVSKEMLHLLQVVRYARHIGSYWETALSTVAAPLQACATGNDAERAVRTTLPRSTDSTVMERHTAEQVVEEVACALALAAESTLARSLASTKRLVAPLPHLAPYMSAYTVGALVQRPFRRALTWEQCLALLPYTPLGSRSQLWLLRRVAQDAEGRRHAFSKSASTPTAFSHCSTAAFAVQGGSRHIPAASPPPPVPPTLMFSQTAMQTAERLMEVQHSSRRLQSRSRSSERIHAGRSTYANAAFSSSPAPPPVATTTTMASTAATFPRCRATTTDSSTDTDATLLKLLLESHWSRALRVFERASPRVQVAGAPHVVRLLISADVWRDIADTQRRPLVRLAVQSSAHTSNGGASALLEEVLQTSLEHGLWYTGLYFHQCVAAEQPELVQQCSRAQAYAAQLSRGLLDRTSMTRMVAQLTKAVRRSQWAEAAACFMRYATRHERSLDSSGGPSDAAAMESVPRGSSQSKVEASIVGGPEQASVRRRAVTAVPPTTAEELGVLAALMSGRLSGGVGENAGASNPPSPSRSSSFEGALGATFFFAEAGGAVPEELAHVAQTVRYAMLHTPALWKRALRWLPTSVLPLPYSHAVAIGALCANNPAKLRALLPERLSTDAEGKASGGDVPVVGAAYGSLSSTTLSLTTAAALSIVADARHTRRPQHPNEVTKDKQAAVANALRVLQRAGAWKEAILLYEKAVESNCMPYGASAAVLETAALGGAPWRVTLFYFAHMAQRLRPSVAASAAALQACAEGGQWELAFRVLQQSVLTQATPVPRLVELAVNTALHCGAWARALAAAHQYRRTRDPRLAHTVLLTFVRTQHWDDAVTYFYDCTCRGLRPLDASLELAIIASEAASEEYRTTALMVGTIASALEDLYRLSGAVLRHILLVQRHVRHASSAFSAHAEEEVCATAADSCCSADGGGAPLSNPSEGDKVLLSQVAQEEKQLRSQPQRGAASLPLRGVPTDGAPPPSSFRRRE
ncbi:hypothetical protein ABL78_7246 [Leptomonas seymouri]|uniref:Uncharacterized protein n=1 Tax=Leptomonas seymouri TaxID=5684 RepID=A0A0N1I296_LEPSE|nr:hypothetical protein ABL78_7246 [Leptomonas seymouri]|eukprot:KPI83714.1 hypothetical protein ABL78_7246 [Leptomonas seymouri]